MTTLTNTTWTNNDYDYDDVALNVTSFWFNVSQYRHRNAALGAVGILLNLLVLPVICRHEDLSVFLKATFCCMATGDLLCMATVLFSGLLSLWVTSVQQYKVAVRGLSCGVFGAGNFNCTVMVAIAAERVIALHRPQLLSRLGKSKVKVVLIQGSLWIVGCLLTLPAVLGGSPNPGGTTPMAVTSVAGLATETFVVIASSLFVCVVYTYLACTLIRRAKHPCNVFDDETSTSRSQRPETGTAVNMAGPASSSSVLPNSLQASSRQCRRFRRATVHCAVMASWFFLAYGPFGWYYLWVLLSATDRQQESYTSRITVISSFPLANSLVDPLLLFWRLLHFTALWDRLQQLGAQARLQGALVWQRQRRGVVRCWGRCCRRVRRRVRRRRNRVAQAGLAAVVPRDSIMFVGGTGHSSPRAVHVLGARNVSPSRSRDASSSSSSGPQNRGRLSLIYEKNGDSAPND